MILKRLGFFFATWSALAGASVMAARAEIAPPCKSAMDLTRFAQPLKHTAVKLTAGEPVTIVALGSSSTAGAGASSATGSYPSRLAEELRAHFPRQEITVVNAGVNGEEASDMLARFDTAVAPAKPDLVIWQVGTNAILRDNPVGPAHMLLHDGLSRIRALGADAILLDPQYVPRVLAKPDSDKMIDMISSAAKELNVDLFPRFALMKGWHESDGLPFSTFTWNDDLHMNDWGYACIAKVLGETIAEAATRPVVSVRSRP